MKNLPIISTVLASLALLTSPLAVQAAHHEGSHDHDKMSKKGDIVDVAMETEGFSTLVAAVKAAGLVEALKGEGPFTVFAPTDEAFAALPEGTLDMLLKPENKEQLQAILKYHVVPAKVMAADVSPGEAPTLEGDSIDITTSYGTVKVDNAKVVKTDIMASNGVIHVINAVILPDSE